MILVDTSIWIDHLHKGNSHLGRLLTDNRILMHPFIIGELACGNLRNRTEILLLLRQMPQITVADDEEVLYYIEQHQLMGQGIGYVDAHLLTATALCNSGLLWTHDKRLEKVTRKQGMAYVIK